jgi:hypothetical protein
MAVRPSLAMNRPRQERRDETDSFRRYRHSWLERAGRKVWRGKTSSGHGKDSPQCFDNDMTWTFLMG